MGASNSVDKEKNWKMRLCWTAQTTLTPTTTETATDPENCQIKNTVVKLDPMRLQTIPTTDDPGEIAYLKSLNRFAK